jgi:hypothetical protein
MRSQMVAEREMGGQRLAAGHDHVQVVRCRAGRRDERLTPRDPLVSLVHVAQLAEAFDRRRHILRRGHHDVDVDHRLRRQARHGRAADMLYLGSEAGNRFPHGRGELLEERRPRFVVVDDDDRRRPGGRAPEDLVDRLVRRLLRRVEPETEPRREIREGFVELLDGPAVVPALPPSGLAGRDRLDRREKDDDVAGMAADHRPVLAEQRPGRDVFQCDREARLEIRVRRSRGEPIAQTELLERDRGRRRRHLLPPADDAAAEDVAFEVDAAREARREQACDGRLAGRHRPGDQEDGSADYDCFPKAARRGRSASSFTRWPSRST